MRRPLIWLGLLACFTFVASGCSDDDGPPPTPTAPPATATAPPSSTPSAVPSATPSSAPTSTATAPPTTTSTSAPTDTATPAPTATTTPTFDAAALAAAGEAAFFDTLYGIQNREAETISLLGSVVTADANAGRSFFLLGMMHLYRASKALEGRYNDPSEFVLTEAALAQSALDEAVPKTPEDTRVPGFRGAVTYLNGVLHQDEDRKQLGLQQLRAAVELYPDFNNFSFLGTVAPVVSPKDPLFAESLELVQKALVGGCTPDTQPEICGNAGKAPHNTQGAFILFGDMYAKAGLPDQALPYYQLTLILPGIDTWPFREIANERIATVQERAALWNDEDPTNDPRFIGSGPEACAICHFK